MDMVMLGQRIDIFKVANSGHASVYIYRGARGRCIAVAEWRGEPMYYWLEPTASARNVMLGDADGLYLATLADCVKYAKGWE